MPVTPNPIDLTTLQNVADWIGYTVGNATQDQLIQDCITALSAYVLKLTGRGPADGSIPTTSPFSTAVTYDEFYDGNGNAEMLLRNWPIQSVTSVNVEGVTITASTGLTSPGYVVDQSKKFLVMRLYAPARAQRGYRGAQFCKAGWALGVQNIEVVYSAGFAAIPFDLAMMARKVVALNYKRRQWIGQKAQAMAGGAGTVSYVDWEMDIQDMRVLDYYKTMSA